MSSMPTDAWRRSSYSGGGNACVEVAALSDDRVGVRDSKLGDRSPVLTVPAAVFADFIDSVKTGQLS